jgi:hypothetical protein
LVLIRLVKWGLRALDIFMLNGPGGNVGAKAGAGGQQMSPPSKKEEKELLDHFAQMVRLLLSFQSLT